MAIFSGASIHRLRAARVTAELARLVFCYSTAFWVAAVPQRLSFAISPLPPRWIFRGGVIVPIGWR